MALTRRMRQTTFLGCLVFTCTSGSVRAQGSEPARAKHGEPLVPVASPAAATSIAAPAEHGPAAAAAPAPADAAAAVESAPAARPISSPALSVEPEAATKERGTTQTRKPSPDPSVGVFFNPTGFVLGLFGLELDFSMYQSAAFNINGVYYDKTVNGISTTAYGLDVGIQFFLTGTQAMRGAYFYPRFGFAKATAEGPASTSTYGQPQKAEVSLFGAGATCGYQWNWYPFALRLGGGLVYYANTVGSSGTSTANSMQGTSILIDLALGLTF